MPLESQIPLPTDNIYKFYALFGLLLFIFSLGAMLYINHSTNDLIFQSIIESEAIRQNPDPSSVDKARLQVLEKRYEIAMDNKKATMIGLAIVTWVSVASTVYGFWKWHRKVQPIQDEIAELQRDKLCLEVSQMKASILSAPPP